MQREQRQLERRENVETHRENIELHRETNERRQEDNADHGYERIYPGGAETVSNPTFHPSRPNTKILVSPGSGAGWVSWAPRGASDGFLVWMLTYEPLIKALERKEHKERLEEIMRDFHKEARVRFNVERIVVARVGDIFVQEVSGPFEVRENEGREWVVNVGHRRDIAM